MRDFRVHLRKGVVAIVVAAMLSLAACGGADGSGSGGGSGGEGGQDAKLIMATTSSSFGPILGMISEGSFSGVGLDLEWSSVNDPVTAIPALLAGEGDFAAVGFATALSAIQEGADLKIVMGATGPMSILVLKTEVAEKLGVDPEDPIEERVGALEGLTIASPPEGSSNMQLMSAILDEYGVDRSSISFVTSEPTSMVAAMREGGGFDGALWGVGVLEQNIADGSAVPWIVTPRGDVPSFDDFIFTAVVARGDTSDEKVARFNEALVEFGKRMDEDPDAVKESIRKEFFPDLDPAAWDQQWPYVTGAFLTEGVVPKDSFEFTKQVLSSVTGVEYDRLTYDGHVVDVAQE